VEPEVYFRIVHAAGDSNHIAPGAVYRERTVEIAMGPKGAFDNGAFAAQWRHQSVGNTNPRFLQSHLPEK